MKILIIDDSLTARLFLKKSLEMTIKDNLEIVEAVNGEDALNKLSDGRVDLILSDVNMPVMSGFTFLRNIKAEAKYSDIPVVFITSLANDARSDNLKALGALDVVKKPVSPSAIAKIINSIINKNQGWGA